tara:strand:+ start:91 stop:1791 length:1701 start_codon:yes stop_codon:yes gene_type:complete
MKESFLSDVFWHAGVFLVLSAIIIPVLRYLKIPAALGYLLAGIALGPHGFSALIDHTIVHDLIGLRDAKHVKILAELGIVLLLFVVGLELTPRRLWQMRNLVFGLGGAQVTITAFVIGGIAYLWGNNVQVSVLLGLSLALSSTAIVTQWLHEKKLFVTHAGRASFSILLFQDLAVIPILLLLTIMSAATGEGVYEFAALSLLKMLFTAAVIYVVGRIALKPLFVFANRHGGAEVFMALSLLAIVVSASVAAMAGLSMALGAFIAGLLLADTEYRHEISSLVIPFKSMLLGIFFLSFGMGINLNFIAEKPFWLFSSVLGLIAIKVVIIFVLCKLWRQSTAVAVESSLLLAQAGEFCLLVVSGALTAGIMNENVAQFMLLNVGITMLLAPVMAPIARRAGALIEAHAIHQQGIKEALPNAKEGHVVIFGFGRVGRSIAHDLCQDGMEIIGFDKNIDIVHKARSRLSPVFVGDASKNATLEAAQIESASCIVVTIDDVTLTRDIIKKIRRISNDIPIIVRAHTQDDVAYFDQMKNVDPVSEEKVLSDQLTERIFKWSGLGQALPDSETP